MGRRQRPRRGAVAGAWGVRYGPGGGLDGGDCDLEAEGLESADVVADLAVLVGAGVVVAGAEVVVAGGGRRGRSR